ncbi:MAG: UDP-N-acetylmuramate--L-alanine ligase [Actinomycetota bacterium]|nr:UDP-N-acetylmuramate--L-alanine ligase [Actinomycetota bacterium]
MDIKKYFLIGIGGAGMSAIALVLKGTGHQVRGSDMKESRYTHLLRNEGIEVIIGHKSSNLKNDEVVVYSAAIPEDNVELAEARKEKFEVIARSDALAQILNSKNGIAISGTHGKTTTTSMVGLLLRGLSLDPTIIIGGELNELGSNARYGEGKYVVAEACESDGSFLKYNPYISVVTNIEDDHMDHYKNHKALEDSFYQFMKNTHKDGFIIADGDCLELKNKKLGKNIWLYGTSKENDMYAENIKYKNFGSSYQLVFKRDGNLQRLNVKLSVPGIHNVRNSLAALSVCCCLGLDMGKSVELLQYFTGAKRRFEKKGEKRGALIFDDYAHHPTEVSATLEAAFQDKKNRLITVFQPHRYSRLSHLLGKFGTCFKHSDILIITDVYGAGEQPLPGITGKALVDEVIESGYAKRLAYFPQLDQISLYLERNIEKDDMVLLMGAGDITRVTEDLLKGSKYE